MSFAENPIPTRPIAEELYPLPSIEALIASLHRLPHLLILDSADIHPTRGRYSYISADPRQWIEIPSASPESPDPFTDLAQIIAEFPMESLTDLPPFQGGIAGLWGYGLGSATERLPPSIFDEFRTPALAVGVYDWVISIDHLQRRAWLVSTGYPAQLESRITQATDRIQQVRAWLRAHHDTPEMTKRPEAIDFAPQYPLANNSEVTSNFQRDHFTRIIERGIEYIHAGDCFQVNLSQRLLTPQRDHPLKLFQRSRERNPAPFAGYLDLGATQIVSASPERFLRVQNRMVETRPIKGTRPQGKTIEEDEKFRRDLLTNPKDRAENVMIVDLLRNDLGKTCRFGSVHVPKLCEIESYRHIHHLVSEVRGELYAGRKPIDLLRGAFPGGSVTGAPKVRAMEIIAELEPTARGAYCGSLGFIGFDGSMDTNILIRTFTVNRGWIQFQVGGGIVADSQSIQEYEETLHKAQGLLRSL